MDAPNKHECGNHNPESLEALAHGDKNRSRVVVFEHVRRCRGYGTTADEAYVALGLSPNSVAPRLTELKRAAFIVELTDAHGKRIRRKTRQACFAAVCVAVEFVPRHAVKQDRLFPDDAPLRHLDLG